MITARFYSSYFCVCCIFGFLLWFLCSNRPQASFAVTYLSLWFLFYLTVILMTSSTLHPVFWSMVWYLLVEAQVPSMSIYDCVCPSVFPWLIFSVFPVGLFTYIMPVSNFSFLLYFEGLLWVSPDCLHLCVITLSCVSLPSCWALHLISPLLLTLCHSVCAQCLFPVSSPALFLAPFWIIVYSPSGLCYFGLSAIA